MLQTDNSCSKKEHLTIRLKGKQSKSFLFSARSIWFSTNNRWFSKVSWPHWFLVHNLSFPAQRILFLVHHLLNWIFYWIGFFGDIASWHEVNKHQEAIYSLFECRNDFNEYLISGDYVRDFNSVKSLWYRLHTALSDFRILHMIRIILI